MATVATHFGSPPPPPPRGCRRRGAAFPAGARRAAAAARGRIRSLRNISCLVSQTAKAPVSGPEPSSSKEGVNEIIDAVEVESTATGASFLAKGAVAISVAATVTVILLLMKQPSSGPSFSLPQIVDASAQSDAAAATIGYTFSLFGKKVIIPEYTPGWVYFCLLMTAGFGLFISEEALNVWLAVGFALRERPVVALASVAAAVGICTVFPYAAAACTALFLYLRRREPSS
nr:unnamed protein product [Digitaria exilis]